MTWNNQNFFAPANSIPCTREKNPIKAVFNQGARKFQLEIEERSSENVQRHSYNLDVLSFEGERKKKRNLAKTQCFTLWKKIYFHLVQRLFSKLLKLKFTRLALWILFFPKKKSSITLHPKKKNSKLPSFPLHRKIISCSPEILLRRTIAWPSIISDGISLRVVRVSQFERCSEVRKRKEGGKEYISRRAGI